MILTTEYCPFAFIRHQMITVHTERTLNDHDLQQTGWRVLTCVIKKSNLQLLCVTTKNLHCCNLSYNIYAVAFKQAALKPSLFPGDSYHWCSLIGRCLSCTRLARIRSKIPISISSLKGAVFRIGPLELLHQITSFIFLKTVVGD